MSRAAWSLVGALIALGAAVPRQAVAQGEKVQVPAAQAIDPGWLSVDATSRTATFDLIAGLTGVNGALNFNGFKDGGLTLTVPVGWTVVMHFRNHDGMLPHSAEVIDTVHPLPVQPVTPAFPKAFTLRLAEGIPSEGRDDIRFIADKGGSYLIFCGVPGHGAAGMWIRFMVSNSVPQPSLATTPPAQH